MKGQQAEHKKIKEKLEESEERYKTLVQTIPDITYELDAEGRFTFVNDAIKRLGYNSEELILKHFSRIMYPDDFKDVNYASILPKYKGKITGDDRAPKLFNERRTAKRMTKNLQLRIALKDRDGPSKNYFHAEVNSSGRWDRPVQDKNKKFLGSIGVIRDATERKKAEETIKSLAKFPSENPYPVLRIAEDKTILYANAAAEPLLSSENCRIGQVIPKRWHQLIDDAFASGSVKQDIEVEYKDRIFSWVMIPINATGYINIYGFDITERKKTEEALKKSETGLREQKLALEQKNLTLRELLEHIERAKNKIKEDITINIEELIVPILEKLELKGVSQKYIKLLYYHLEELSLSFGRKITQRSTQLSPREIEICSMIKGGLTSKEVSEFLNISYKTVDKHRRNIRKKLGISKKRVNLTTFLQEL